MSKVWFITGAGSGIGAGTAKAALRAGDRVIATGILSLHPAPVERLR
jgi:NAD(P)-dependent dehydrogenase (short-subunit alcohol dehydrogenase family)